jgi:group I intron endonuclease
MKGSGVYKIQSISHPERCYIGSTNKFSRRKWEHFHRLRKNNHDSPKLQAHYNKYGESDLVFSIVARCEPERAWIKEQCYLNIYKPWFNISPTVGSSQGIVRSDEFRQKVSLEKKGKTLSEEHKGRISKSMQGENNSMYGKEPWIKGKKNPFSEETLAIIGEAARKRWKLWRLEKQKTEPCLEFI